MIFLSTHILTQGQLSCLILTYNATPLHSITTYSNDSEFFGFYQKQLIDQIN